MHNLILKIFEFIKGIFHLLKISSAFLVAVLLLFWIQNIIGASWNWLGFITPFLNSLLDFANSICSVSFNLFGANVELKYISAIIFLVAVGAVAHILIIALELLETGYKSTHYICKKTEEMLFNKKLKEDDRQEEVKKLDYTVIINTRIKPKFSHAELNINLEEQNDAMNKFLAEKLNVLPRQTDFGYMYCFNNFNKVDNVLDILFKVINSTAPLDYAVCVQIGNNTKQLHKLVSLENYGKVIMAADTAHRYSYNSSHRYETSSLGVFQYENTTLEVREFIKI